MTSFVSHTTIDCENAYELSEWWRQVLGYQHLPDDPNEPGHEECMIRDPESGHEILFIEVPDGPKRVKNRVHFDLRPRSGSRDDEIERVRGLGATELSDHRGQYGPGTGWVVFADPEGNEFCILRSIAEIEASQAAGAAEAAEASEAIGASETAGTAGTAGTTGQDEADEASGTREAASSD
jgi:hypothetical protein